MKKKKNTPEKKKNRSSKNVNSIQKAGQRTVFTLEYHQAALFTIYSHQVNTDAQTINSIIDLFASYDKKKKNK